MTFIDLDTPHTRIEWQPQAAGVRYGTADGLWYAAMPGVFDGPWLCRVTDDTGMTVAVFTAKDFPAVQAGVELRHEDWVCRRNLLHARIR